MMKCEHCGRNDATFYYRSNVNGQVSEGRLSEECAAALGYRGAMREPFEDLFSMVSGDFFGDSFFSAPRLTPTARRTLRVLPAEEEHEQPLLSADEQSKLRRERERNALRLALDEALEAEDYERCATLRDELKRLED